jgi:hypothetical protein
MVVHFIRHRPEWYWFWVIVFFGPIGASVKDLRALAKADAKHRLHSENLALAKADEGPEDEDKAHEVYRSIL